MAKPSIKHRKSNVGHDYAVSVTIAYGFTSVVHARNKAEARAKAPDWTKGFHKEAKRFAQGLKPKVTVGSAVLLVEDGQGNFELAPGEKLGE